ncbi:MAG TPA: hypothetical protein DHW82_11830 [Spirochaetia bacterium]|nr:MAG: hypothetical protein A2Y41_14020 [Spirochaetes bacterium GWB1_36_13]HCL57681.1 hypothetical protein [Spirochaetia bacterium]
MKKILLVLLLTIFSSGLFSLTPKEIEKATQLIEKVNNFYNKNPKLKGYFKLYINEQESGGYFFFNGPSQLKLFFGPEKTDDPEKFRYILTDGNTLWLFLPYQKVLVEQEIPEYFKDIGVLGMGMLRFLSNYEELELSEEVKNDKKLIVLNLKKPNKNLPYEEITLYIDEEGFVPILKGKMKQGNKSQNISFYRYNINKNPVFTEKDFKVKPSGEIQILRNVFVNSKK